MSKILEEMGRWLKAMIGKPSAVIIVAAGNRAVITIDPITGIAQGLIYSESEES
jgi:hypothetical protein